MRIHNVILLSLILCLGFPSLGKANVFVTKPITVTSGASYEGSIDLNNSSGTDLFIRVLDENGSLIPNSEVTITSNNSGVFSFLFEASSTNNYTVWVGFDDNTSTQFSINNFQLSEIEIVEEQVCSSDSDYRYGFNGMEKDDEVKGSGMSYSFEARLLDPRLGRWLSMDPKQAKYPWSTPYSFVANKPIIFVDHDGEEIVYDPSLSSKQLKRIQKTVAKLMEDAKFKAVWDYMMNDADVTITIGAKSLASKVAEEEENILIAGLVAMAEDPRVVAYYHPTYKYISIKKGLLGGKLGLMNKGVPIEDLYSAFAEELFHAYQDYFYNSVSQQEGYSDKSMVEVEAKLFTSSISVDGKPINSNQPNNSVEFLWSQLPDKNDLYKGAMYDDWSLSYQLYMSIIDSEIFQMYRAFKISLDQEFKEMQGKLREYGYSDSNDELIGSGYEAFSKILNNAKYGSEIGTYEEDSWIVKKGKKLLNNGGNNSEKKSQGKSKNPRFL